MENEKNQATPWILLEIAAEIMDPAIFKAYYDAHPEEARVVLEYFQKEPYIPQDRTPPSNNA